METIGSAGFLQLFWASVLDHLWQSTLFALVVFAVLALLRQAPARLRCALYLLIPLKFLVPSGLVLGVIHRFGIDLQSAVVSMAWATSDPLVFVNRQNSVFHVGTGFVEGTHPASSTAWTVVLALWAAGTVWVAGHWIVRQFALMGEIRRSRVLLQGREAELLAKLQRRLKLLRRVRIATSAEFTEIGVFGVCRPWILLPESIADHLTDSELEAILLHELVHIARWDNLMSHISMSVCSLFWFHPVVWLTDRMLLSERERVCDDRVLELGGASRTYAESLIKVLKFGLGFRIAGVSCAGGPHLKRRIETIASGKPAPRANILHRLAVTAVFLSLAALCVAAIQVDRCLIDPIVKKPAARAHSSDCNK